MTSIDPSEIKLSFIRSPGPGGQNVNKVATGVQLRFNLKKSLSIPEDIRSRLFSVLGNKLTVRGDIIIKATRYRSQERNKQDAVERLVDLIKRASFVPKKRKKTKPTRASTERRLEKKKSHGKRKSLRTDKFLSE
jgi:ribosome-associated protein